MSTSSGITTRLVLARTLRDIVFDLHLEPFEGNEDDEEDKMFEDFCVDVVLLSKAPQYSQGKVGGA